MKAISVMLLLLAGVATSAYAESYSCVVAKKNFISVVLLNDSGGPKHRVTLESLTLHENGSARVFRIHDGVPWQIPTVCKNEMEKKLTAEEISRVNMKIFEAK